MQPIYNGLTIIGYTYSNGYVVWTYNTSWQMTGMALDTNAITTGALTPVRDLNNATIAYTYTDPYGAFYTYNVDAAGNITVYTTHYSGAGYTYTYSFDSLGNFAGYTYFDGTTTTTYGADWSVISVVTAPPPNLTQILDVNGAIIGYSVTDQWGTTTNYALDMVTVTGYSYRYVDSLNNTSVSTYDANWNYLGSETRNAAGNVLYYDVYSYVNGVFSGYTYFDGTTTWNYDANWNLLSSTVNTAGMTPILDGAGVTIGYSSTDAWGTTTTYNLAGVKTGSSYTMTNWDGTITVTTNDANGIFLSSETRDATGKLLYSYADIYTAGVLTGHTSFDGLTTWAYDANWNLLSSTVSTAGMTPILDGAGVTIGYSSTDAWGTTTTYNLAGVKTGSRYTWTDTWSGNVSITSYDANGNYLGSETRNANGKLLYSDTYSYVNGVFNGYTYFDGITTTVYDANWAIVSSTVNTAGMTPILDGAGVTIGYSNTDAWGTTTTYNLAGVKTGSRYTWTDTWSGNVSITSYDANGNYIGSETRNASGKLLYSDAYSYVNGVFNGYTYSDGITTWVYDANWNLLSSTVNTAGMTPILDGAGVTIGYSSTDAWGTTTTYNLAGVKTGSRYTWTDTWSGNVSITSYDANGNYIGSETRNASGKLLYSDTYSYVNGVFNGYTYFDGITTWAYDANWNLLSSTVNIAALTPILDGLGVTIGYSSTDAWGTTTTYNLAGVKTGYSYTWIDSWSNTTTVTMYDANWNFLRSETRDATGKLLYSNADIYTNGVLTGHTSFDGTTTTVYDTNWNLLSSTVNTAGMTPILDGAGVTIGYSSTDAWGTTTTYDLNGVKTGSRYTWTDTLSGNTTVTTSDANGIFLRSETRDATGKLLYSNADIYTNGVLSGHTSFDGLTTTVYDANWNMLSSTVNTAGMTPILDVLGVTIGYSSTDAWGTTTTYDMNGVKTGSRYSWTDSWSGNTSVWYHDATGNYLGSETRNANGKLLYSDTYSYVNGVYSGYTYFDGTTIWTYDSNWNLLSSTVNIAAMTPILDGTGATIGYSNTDAWGTTTTYNLNGVKTGSSNTWTNWDGTTTVTTYDANGIFLGSETRDATGKLLYSNADIYTNGLLTGHTSFDGLTTTVYDANWNLLSSTVNTAGMTPILDGLGVTIGYSSTDAWGTTTTYDLNGVRTGSSYTWTDPWSNTTTITTYDANWNFLSSETRDATGRLLYSNADIYTNGVLTGHTSYDGFTTWNYDANWNLLSSTVNTAGMTPILDGAGATIGYSSTDAWGTTTTYNLIGVKTGSYSTWTDSWSNTTTVTTYDANGVFLSSETRNATGKLLYSNSDIYTNGVLTGHTSSDGITTTVYDANWGFVSSTVNIAALTPILDGTGVTIGYSSTDAWGTTTTYDLIGVKTGYSYTWIDSWSNTTTVTMYDANWNFLRSETRDATGKLLYSNADIYTNGVLTGHTSFDGLTTTVYDANWNLLSSTVNTAGMTPILDGAGVAIGYSSTDAWGTTTTYDLNGVKTGSSYIWTDTWSGNTTVTTSDANGIFLRSETRDATGKLLYSNADIYTNGVLSGHTSFDGLTTTVYDANWNLLSSTVNTAGMTPILDGVGVTIGYSSTDAWGTTTTYDLNGVKTGSRYSWTDTWSGNTSVWYYDANGNSIGSETRNASGKLLYSDTYSYVNGVFSGYTYFDGTTIWTYDANWVFVSSAVNTAVMTPILDGTGATIGYSNTDAWGTTTTYNLNGVKTGSSYTSTNWDGTTTVTTYDANGVFLSSETRDATGKLLYSNSDIYTNGVLNGHTSFDGLTTMVYDANWNLLSSTVNTAGMTQIKDGTGTTIGYSHTDAGGTTTTYDLNGVRTGSSYTWTDPWSGNTTVTTSDANWNFLRSETRDVTGKLLYSNADIYTNGVLTGHTSYDGFTTWNYDANWNLLSSTVNTAGMTPILDGLGVTIGYSSTDAWGTTTTYDLNGVKTGSSYTWTDTWSGITSVNTYDANGVFLSYEMRDVTGKLLYSNADIYTAGVLTGHTSYDGLTTTVYDANWGFVSSTVNIAALTPILDGMGVTIGYSYTDAWGTTTTYNLAGVKTGSSYSWTDTWSGNTTVTTYDANGIFLSSQTRDATGKLLYSNADIYTNGVLTGHTSYDGFTNTVYDANWVVVSSSVNTAGMTPILDGMGVTIGYSSTDATGTTTTYNLAGVKTGSFSTLTDALSGNTTTTHLDANGIFLSSEIRDATGRLLHSNADIYANGVLTGHTSFDGITTTIYDANWGVVSSTVNTAGMTPVLDVTGVPIGYSYTNVWGTTTTYSLNGVKTGSFSTMTDALSGNITTTYLDANGIFLNSQTRDATGVLLHSTAYSYVNGVFNGYTYTEGATTWVYDANWILLSSTVNKAAMTPILDATGATIGYSYTNALGTTTTYDLNVVKTGSSSIWTDALSGNTTITYQDANGIFLSSETRDATGKLLHSNADTYTAGVLTGHTSFDGITTTVYDANWGIVSSTVNIAGMTPILDATGIIGYGYIDATGTYNTYDLNGVKTGSSHTRTDPLSGNITVTTYDANGIFLSSVTSGATGNVLHSNADIYTAGVLTGHISYDGFATWNYDANWNVLSSAVNTAGMPYSQGNYQAINALGVTIYYDLNGVKTGSGNFWQNPVSNMTTYVGLDAGDKLLTMQTHDYNYGLNINYWEIYTNGVLTGHTSYNFNNNTTYVYDANWRLVRSSTWSSSSIETVTTYDVNGNILSSETRDINGKLLHSNADIYTNGVLTGHTSYDGLTTLTYDANWNLLSSTVNTAAMTPILDVAGVTIGFSNTDAWGITTTYDLNGVKTGIISTDSLSGHTTTTHLDANGNFIGSETRDAAGNLLYSNADIYTAGVLTGHTSFDGFATWNYDAKWNLLGTANTAAMTPVLDVAGATIGYSYTDAWGSLITCNLNGVKTGSTWTDALSGNTTVMTHDANGRFLSSETRDPTGNLLHSNSDIYTNGMLTGHTSFDGITNTVYNANWGVVSSNVNMAALTPVLDGAGATIGYSNTIVDQTGVPQTITYTVGSSTTTYDLNGVKTGSSYTRYVVATGYTTVTTSDANGIFLSSETSDIAGKLLYSNADIYTAGVLTGRTSFDGVFISNYDANGNLLGSTLNTANMTPILDVTGFAIGYSNTVTVNGLGDSNTTTYDLNGVKTGSSSISLVGNGATTTSYLDANGKFLSSSTRDAAGNLLHSSADIYTAGVLTGHTYFDGIATRFYDANWNLLNSTVSSTAGMTAILDGVGATIGYGYTDVWGVTTTYNLNGVKTGSSYTGNDPFGNITVATIDANGRFVSSETRDATGRLLHSNADIYTAGVLTGHTYFDGITTTVYGANWVIVSSTVNIAGMTPILGAAGATIGYSYTDAAGTTHTYDPNGVKTGSSYTRTDPLTGNTTLTTSDANGVFLSSETRDATGKLLYSNADIYTNGVLTGHISFDGFTTWTYGANWNLLSSKVNTAGMTPILDGAGMTIGFSNTDAWGTTTTYNLAGVKTGSSYTWTDALSGNTIVTTSDANGIFLASQTRDATGKLLSSSADIYTNGVLTGHTYFDGITTWNYDANWTLLSSTLNTAGMTPILDGMGATIGYSNTDAWGITTSYNLNGVKTGSSYTFTDPLNGNTTVTTYDANGIYLSFVTRDATGRLLLSGTEIYTAGVLTGHISFDGVTTRTYDLNWNLLDTTAPQINDVSFGTGANAAITMTFSENVTYDMAALQGSALLNGAGANIGTGVTVVNNVATITTNATLAPTDWLLLTTGSEFKDAAGNALLAGQVGAIGGSGNNTIDMSAYGQAGLFMDGYAGNDILIGSAFSDTIYGGDGADTITGGGSQDNIWLGEMVAASDTVVIAVGDSTPAGGAADLVHGFDVVSGAANDILDLPSAVIAANTNGLVAGGTAFGQIVSHSITNGIISFFDAAGASVVVADLANWGQVKSYMGANIADGQTVATYIDMNGNGLYTDVVDRMAVYQGNVTIDVQVQLYDTMGMVTALSNIAQVNSVTII